MIRKNQTLFNRLNCLSDIVLVLLSYLFASWLWLDIVRKINDNMASLDKLDGTTLAVAVLYALWTVTLLAAFGLYSTSRVHRHSRSSRSILYANAVALTSGAAMLYLFRLVEFSRGVLAVYFLVSSVLLVTKRIAVRAILRYYRKRGYNLKHMLVVGSGELAKQYIDSVNSDKSLGIHVVERLNADAGLKKRLEKRLSSDLIDEVIIALDPHELGMTEEVVSVCEKCGTRMSVIPFYNDVIPTKPTIDLVGNIKLIRLRTTPLDNPLNAFIKRSFDVVVSFVLLIVLSPLFLILALAIKASTSGPVFFQQERVGYNKKRFMMYKFRSMVVNDEQDSAWSTASDARRTRIGSLLRKTSLDELPQLYNVLRGDMSLIGPRPEIPYYVEQFRESVPLYMVKNQVRPGMTGWAQIHGLRGDTSIPDRVKHDIWYIENWSFGLDIEILLRTAFGGMLNREEIAKDKAK